MPEVQVLMFYLSDGQLWNAVFETVDEWAACMALGMYKDVTITETTVVPVGGQLETNYTTGFQGLLVLPDPFHGHDPYYGHA